MTFKEKVVKLRKMKGLTQDEFASAVGVSRQAVYKWESGQSYPEVSKLLEMKVLFNISIDDLLDENYEVIVPEKKKKRVTKAVREKVESSLPVVEEIEKEAPAKEIAEPILEEAVVTAPVEDAPAEDAAPVSEEIAAEPQKKVGFFGRLFGRK